MASSVMAGEDEIAPQWSSDGQYIFYYSYRHPDPSLVHKVPSVTMRVKPDGSDKIILSDGSSRNWWVIPDMCAPTSCADTPLFVISERDAKEDFGGSNLYSFAPKHHKYIPLTNVKPEKGEWVLAPSLSRDGRFLSYIWQQKFRDNKSAKLYLWDRETDTRKEIPLPHEELHDATLKPDGTGIIYSPNDFEIFHYSLKTGQSTKLYSFEESGGQFMDGLQASPNGKSILFSYGRENFKSAEIYILNLADKTLEQITHNSISDLRPAWHPGGNIIAFNRIPDPEQDWNDIIIYSLSDKTETNISDPAQQ